jgi:polysaccharide biosynthesis/export protein
MLLRFPIAVALPLFFCSTVALSQDPGSPQHTSNGTAINGTAIAGIEVTSSNGDAYHGSDYKLGPGDQITIHVLDLNEIPSTPFRIDSGGYISVPVVGPVKAQGLTTDEVAAAVRERLKHELVNPDVGVSIAEFRSQPVSVLGSVVSPGIHQLEGHKTLLEMIVLAGGIRPEAGNTIHITRELKYGKVPLPDATEDSSGRFSVASVRTSGLMGASEPQGNIEIKPHDVISVPRGELIYVLGAVVRAGGYVLNENDSLSALQIMSLAGGLGRFASPQQARILRPADGSANRAEIGIDLKKILNGKAPDVALHPNDVLIVPVSGGKAAAMRTIEAAVGIGTAAATASIYRF